MVIYNPGLDRKIGQKTFFQKLKNMFDPCCKENSELPIWAPKNSIISLPSTHEPWDFMTEDEAEPPIRSKAGTYRWQGVALSKYRPSTETRWSPIQTGILKTKKGPIPLLSPKVCQELAYVGLLTPDSHYLEGEKIELQFLPARAGIYEIELKGIRGFKAINKFASENHCLFKEGLPVGEYRARVRWIPPLDTERAQAWSAWSIPTKFTVHPKRQRSRVEELRIYEHKLSLISDRDVRGVPTITDPWTFPPACPLDEEIRWFRMPCYEGSTVLLNEVADYYRDPMGYYLDCIQRLLDKGVVFFTWHDLLDGRIGSTERGVVLQFDVDGGPLSMERLARELMWLGVRATVMMHREAHDWYVYQIEELDLNYLKGAEKKGWAVGYHNNSIGNVQRLERIGDYGPEILQEAQNRFRADVQILRREFNIRSFTHHGGNVLNLKTPVPDDLDLVCVDKPFNPDLWKIIRSAFSDGGFFSRPCSLREKVETLTTGIHFFRCHPVKYGNFTPPFDIPPLDPKDAVKRGYPDDMETARLIEKEVRKQNRWLYFRDKYRIKQRLNCSSPDKPISSGFEPFSVVRSRAEAFRNQRREHFLREYPWIEGDPRVFWWRMLETYGPKDGEVLNVGALPPQQCEETTAFLGHGIKVLEMDIDVNREPDLVCDITQAPEDQNGRFSGTFLFGLPYFHSPSLAIEACSRLTRPGGVGLFGMAAAYTHPFRGGLWKPETRPVWRKELEPLQNIGLKGLLWSFDQECIEALFVPWDNVQIEFFSHYWFVVCRKRSI